MSDLLNYLLENEPQFRRARLSSLYSDFRPLRNLNPDGYTANILAWITSLTSALRAGVVPATSTPSSIIILSVNQELFRSLETKQWGQPLALGTVIREALLERQMMELKEFLAAKASIYRRAWAVPSPWGVLAWGLRQLGLGGGAGGEDKLPVGKVVIVGLVEEAARLFQKRCGSLVGLLDRVYTRRAFAEEFGGLLGRQMSTDDLEVFLRFLERDMGLLIYNSETVKINTKKERWITQEDTAIAASKTLIKDLEAQTKALEQRLDHLNVTAKEAVASRNRLSALAALKSKKLVESTLTKRHATLSQLEEVIIKIEQAADQVELIQVMEASTKVLSGLNNQIGGVDRVHNVIDQLGEQMTQVDEIGNAMTDLGENSIDDTEIDDELDAIEAEQKKKEAEKEREEEVNEEARAAAETERKLHTLEIAEQQAKRVEVEQEKLTESGDANLQKGTENMKKLSLDPTKENVTAQ